MEGALLRTKFYVPALQPNHIPRTHLNKRLTEQLNRGSKLSLLSAPAGFGKTTLAVSWLHKADIPVAWLSLDEEDDDPARFMAYLLAALRRIDLGMGQEVDGILAAPQKPPPEILLAAIINDIAMRPDGPNSYVLLLDDYHLIENQTIHQALSFLIEHQPPQLHLVVLTREDPPLHLARLRARQQMAEVRLADLRFTALEISTLLNNKMGLNLTPQQIEALEDRTEGWVSGLQLAALSMRGHNDVDAFVDSFAGSNRYILDYLIEEVFQQQPPEVQSFLLTTAILDQLTAPLCDALRVASSPPDPPSQMMLEQLEAANLFIIPLDSDRQWFRYHHLFADLLRHRLRQENHNLSELHTKAGDWHATHGFPNRAISHYLTAEAWEPASDLIATQSDKLLKRGENITLLRWARQLPDSIIFTNPKLCLDFAWALALSGEVEQADTYLQVAEEAAQREPALYGEVLTAQIHVARARHDLSRTISLSERALSLIPADRLEVRSVLGLNLGIAQWQSGQLEAADLTLMEATSAAQQGRNQHVELIATGILGILKAAAGRLTEAVESLQQVLEWGGEYPASALVHSVLGAIYYEWNRLDESGRHLQQALTLAERSGNNEVLSSVYRYWAQLKQAQGDHQAALTAMRRAIAIAGEDAPPLTQGRNAAAYVRIALVQGDLETAQKWVGKGPPAAASPFYLLLDLAPARLSLALGDKEAASAHLAAQYDIATRAGWKYAQIEIRLLQALAADSKKDAEDYVADALVLAEPEGFIRTFLDKGEGLIPLIHLAASQNVASGYAQNLLTEFGAKTFDSESRVPKLSPQPELVEPLSAREQEILGLLAAGHTNHEIARSLFVSVNTVKSHLKNIYGKLGVNNRRAAVAQARIRGLINSGLS